MFPFGDGGFNRFAHSAGLRIVEQFKQLVLIWGLLWLSWGSFGAILGQSLPQVGPRWPQDGPMMTPTGPKTATRLPKMAPRWPKMAPRGPKTENAAKNITRANTYANFTSCAEPIDADAEEAWRMSGGGPGEGLWVANGFRGDNYQRLNILKQQRRTILYAIWTRLGPEAR